MMDWNTGLWVLFENEQFLFFRLPFFFSQLLRKHCKESLCKQYLWPHCLSYSLHIPLSWCFAFSQKTCYYQGLTSCLMFSRITRPQLGHGLCLRKALQIIWNPPPFMLPVQNLLLRGPWTLEPGVPVISEHCFSISVLESILLMYLRTNQNTFQYF